MTEKVKMDPMLSLAVMAAFSAEQACEHSQHNDTTQSMYHDGQAEWYMQVSCDDCGYLSNLISVCDKWKQTMERHTITYCQLCGKGTTSTILVRERIK